MICSAVADMYAPYNEINTYLERVYLVNKALLVNEIHVVTLYMLRTQPYHFDLNRNIEKVLNIVDCFFFLPIHSQHKHT